jgi:hypothetical protein
MRCEAVAGPLGPAGHLGQVPHFSGVTVTLFVSICSAFREDVGRILLTLHKKIRKGIGGGFFGITGDGRQSRRTYGPPLSIRILPSAVIQRGLPLESHQQAQETKTEKGPNSGPSTCAGWRIPKCGGGFRLGGGAGRREPKRAGGLIVPNDLFQHGPSVFEDRTHTQKRSP